MEKKKYDKRNITIGIIGGAITLVILVVGTILSFFGAQKDSEKAVRSVSLLYLSELSERRAAVVSANIENNEEVIKNAIDLIEPSDLVTIDSLKSYQARMKDLFNLDKFAFVNEEGTIYTAVPTDNTIEDYAFSDHYLSIDGPEVSILNVEDSKKVVIALKPDKDLVLDSKKLVVCFMEIDSEVMLKNISIDNTNSQSVTFCNVYTTDGIALTNAVLGGLAAEDNLLDAMKQAEFSDDYSSDLFIDDFNSNKSGIVSFTYNGTKETLSYAPVKGTNWRITYLVRESVIASRLSNISNRLVLRTLVTSSLIALVLVVIFVYIIFQNRKTSELRLKHELLTVESKVKQDELQEKLRLQEQLVEQNKLITALSSDYLSVYYVELDKDEGTCYQAFSYSDAEYQQGQVFPYLEAVYKYANEFVAERYRDEFIEFSKPENIKKTLKNNSVISYRYIVKRHDVESFEMIRIAGVRHPEDREGDDVHVVGICFTNVDEETRSSIAQNEMLSSALLAAEQASRAKTTFLSNMSHEIRTPMNAIIGLDNIALNDETISPKTKDCLEKIGASAEHLLNLINDILDMSRIESGRMVLKNEEFAFSKLLEYINTTFSGQCQINNLYYNCHIEGLIDDAYIGDGMKLRQVLINILGNAVKFTNPGGSIDFTVSKKAEFGDKVALEFVIKDTGIGMSKEFLPHIFDSFTQENASSTNKYGSSGLGLAITKNIVDMMNGTINVESEKGKGTTFTVTITLQKSENKQLLDDVEININDLSVLIIDDDQVALEHAKLTLKEIGIKADIAGSGKEALEKVKLADARQSSFNLILVDWKMPEMDGLETTKAIREVVGNESTIIILTAYKWDEVLDDAVKVGVDSFIAKPLFAKNVIEEFKHAIISKGLRVNKEKETTFEGMHILLAEDVEINAEIMQTILEDKGIIVDIAENGKIAVEKFINSNEGYYSAILMDVRMPEMDGLEATRVIRNTERKDANLPIIALTANAFDEDVQRSLQAGLNAHLTKPIQIDLLFETLKKLI